MLIGVPAETKVDEGRVALTPPAVRELVEAGHSVLIQTDAGRRAGYPDAEYEAAGARVVAVDDVFDAELVLKVKEPSREECSRLRRGQVLFAYLHLAADRDLTEGLLASGVTAVAYETVEHAGTLPMLIPMSEIAGRLATQVGASCLEAHRGGRGVLLGSVGGAPPARVVVVGAGNVGRGAIEVAVGMGAQVVAFDRDLRNLAVLRDHYRGRVVPLAPSRDALERAVAGADLVIGAVLTAGARAPLVLRREDLGLLEEGAVVVDVAIDQGGCFETSRPTTHREPTFVQDGVVHYCVTNMPGAVPRTATTALVNATLPYVLRIASLRLEQIVRDPELVSGVNVHDGVVTNPGVADAHGLPYTDLKRAA